MSERLRILRAARDGRLRLNDAGRYVIDGEAQRPDPETRQRLVRDFCITWPRYSTGVVMIMAAGRCELEEGDS